MGTKGECEFKVRALWEDRMDWEVRTTLPQVVALWRFSMGAGAASTEAVRKRVVKKEVYMLGDLGVSVDWCRRMGI
jgi:hypothetical protein